MVSSNIQGLPFISKLILLRWVGVSREDRGYNSWGFMSQCNEGSVYVVVEWDARRVVVVVVVGVGVWVVCEKVLFVVAVLCWSGEGKGEDSCNSAIEVGISLIAFIKEEKGQKKKN